MGSLRGLARQPACHNPTKFTRRWFNGQPSSIRGNTACCQPHQFTSSKQDLHRAMPGRKPTSDTDRGSISHYFRRAIRALTNLPAFHPTQTSFGWTNGTPCLTRMGKVFFFLPRILRIVAINLNGISGGQRGGWVVPRARPASDGCFSS